MRFKDLPRLTKVGSYYVTYELKYFIPHILEEIEEGLILNPDFQRGHVWTEEQQVKFIEYFLMGGDTGIIHFNAPCWPNVDNDGTYVCVDGLQRLTAFMRYYNNEIKAFGYYYKEMEGRPDNIIKISVNNLKTRKEVLQWYIEMNSGGTPHSNEEISKVKKLLVEEVSNEISK